MPQLIRKLLASIIIANIACAELLAQLNYTCNEFSYSNTSLKTQFFQTPNLPTQHNDLSNQKENLFFEEDDDDIKVNAVTFELFLKNLREKKETQHICLAETPYSHMPPPHAEQASYAGWVHKYIIINLQNFSHALIDHFMRIFWGSKSKEPYDSTWESKTKFDWYIKTIEHFTSYTVSFLDETLEYAWGGVQFGALQYVTIFFFPLYDRKNIAFSVGAIFGLSLAHYITRPHTDNVMTGEENPSYFSPLATAAEADLVELIFNQSVHESVYLKPLHAIAKPKYLTVLPLILVIPQFTLPNSLPARTMLFLVFSKELMAELYSKLGHFLSRAITYDASDRSLADMFKATYKAKKAYRKVLTIGTYQKSHSPGTPVTLDKSYNDFWLSVNNIQKCTKEVDKLYTATWKTYDIAMKNFTNHALYLEHNFISRTKNHSSVNEMLYAFPHELLTSFQWVLNEAQFLGESLL